jgi:HAD superfamily hydrolase (TIGR01548 family)
MPIVIPETVPPVAEPKPVSWLFARPYVRSSERRPIDLRLDANEGAVPPEAFLARCGLTKADAATYPSTAALEALLAQEHGVAPGRVVVTAGADDAIERLCRVTCEPGRTALATDPTFEMIPRFVRAALGTLRSVPWLGGGFPVEAMADLADASTGLACVVSPNNPTGGVIQPQELERLRERLPGCPILVDLAYGEFAAADLTALAAAMPNTVVTRTFSKAWGLAGLRVGYAIADERLAGWMRQAGLPYAASGYSLEVARRWWVEGREVVGAYARQVMECREELERLLVTLGVTVTPSQGNFVFAKFEDAGLVADLLAGLGIAVRRYPPGGALADWLRISVPVGKDYERLAAALRAVLAPGAIIFDMDGVLADVSLSYREAIVRTCASWGVAITREDVARIKEAGNANNDWIVTQRLLAQRGIEVELAEVTRRFEGIYQGTGDQPGLRSTESLLLSREVLAKLASRYSLGIVTGRPRADAMRFLREQGIGEVFDAVVCMEDAPIKPDPAPVRLCVKLLGERASLSVGGAWMIGDTRDDVVAARGAGVVPIGVVAPRDDAAVVNEKLLDAGAGRVLARTLDLLEMLP